MSKSHFTKFFSVFVMSFLLLNILSAQQKIDRKKLVRRHVVHVSHLDTLSSLTVGNGRFAFTVDATGLQTFPAYYKKGVPLGTQSEWGWHSFPNLSGFKEEEALKTYTPEGIQRSYMVQVKQPARNKEAADYFRINQHRLQLGNIGFEIIKKDGRLVAPADIKNIHQELDPWTGEIKSHFVVQDIPVDVITYGHPDDDAIAVKIVSPLLLTGNLQLRIRLPYPTGSFADEGTNYNDEALHKSLLYSSVSDHAIIQHTLDTTIYYVNTSWKGAAAIHQKSAHYFLVKPAKTNVFEIAFSFTQKPVAKVPQFGITKALSENEWKKFWMSGGAVDFEGSTDKRANELERRIILSQYLTRVQCAGNFPPQETGLTYNSWYGKPHMEMIWWHAAHFALWNRPEFLNKTMQWYFTAATTAKAIAQRQGFNGMRWQKMTDNEGREVPSSVGAFLIWQQPHLIYLTELLYRNKKNKAVLDKYKDLIFATADFMASFPTYDKVHDRYNLGKGLIPAQECFDAMSTYNPTYELAYWSWGLTVAQRWRERLGMRRKKEWDEVLQKLAPLPQKNGVYLATESTPDSYDADSKYTIDHPGVLAALATIPASNYLDTSVMLKTYQLVDSIWHWNHTWGWDFPLIAMTATRLNRPNLAVDGLFKNVITNTYLPNGHNYQTDRLTIYLPGNGGLLSAIALMCAGYEGCKNINPGFPRDGSWKVNWENLSPMF